jgi:putative transcriptional regulator
MTKQIRLKWNLRKLMAEKKISNKALSAKLGVHPTSVSRLKQSDEMPKINGNDLAIICNALGCRLAELLEEIDQ